MPASGTGLTEQQRAGAIEVLGVITYGEISAFFRLAEDAAMAPSLEDKVALAAMAVTEFSHVSVLRERIVELGGDPVAAVEPFERPLEEFHAHTAPKDWYESLVKAYVGDSLAADFYREIADQLDEKTREVVLRCLEDSGHAEFVVERVRAAIAADPRLGGRLALWGRRLMGEALSQAQRVAAERDALLGVLAGGSGFGLNELSQLLARLTDGHTARMQALGLDA